MIGVCDKVIVEETTEKIIEIEVGFEKRVLRVHWVVNDLYPEYIMWIAHSLFGDYRGVWVPLFLLLNEFDRRNRKYRIVKLYSDDFNIHVIIEL